MSVHFGSTLKRTPFAFSFLATADVDFGKQTFLGGNKQISQPASCLRRLVPKDHFASLAMFFSLKLMTLEIS